MKCMLALVSFGLAFAVSHKLSAQNPETKDNPDMAEGEAPHSDTDTGERAQVEYQIDERPEDVAKPWSTLPASPGKDPGQLDSSESPGSRSPSPNDVQTSFSKRLSMKSNDGMFSFRPDFMGQFLFSVPIDADADKPLESVGFSIKRVRLGALLSLSKRFFLRTQFDMRTGSAALVDAYCDVVLVEEAFVLRGGYHRTWLGRQNLTGYSRRMFVEDARAWADKKMGLDLGRDLGFSIYGMIADALDYGIGVWNGEGGAVFSTKSPGTIGDEIIPGNIDVMVGGRVALHPLSALKAGESLPIGEEQDISTRSKPALSMGVAAMINPRHDGHITLPALAEDESPTERRYDYRQTKLGAELAFAYRGFSLMSEIFLLQTSLKSTTDPALEEAISGSKVLADRLGAYAQAGYFLIPTKMCLGARFDFADDDRSAKGYSLHPAFHAAFHFSSHNAVLLAMYRANVHRAYNEEPNLTTHDVFVMMQIGI